MGLLESLNNYDSVTAGFVRCDIGSFLVTQAFCRISYYARYRFGIISSFASFRGGATTPNGSYINRLRAALTLSATWACQLKTFRATRRLPARFLSSITRLICCEDACRVQDTSLCCSDHNDSTRKQQLRFGKEIHRRKLCHYLLQVDAKGRSIRVAIVTQNYAFFVIVG